MGRLRFSVDNAALPGPSPGSLLARPPDHGVAGSRWAGELVRVPEPGPRRGHKNTDIQDMASFLAGRSLPTCKSGARFEIRETAYSDRNAIFDLLEQARLRQAGNPEDLGLQRESSLGTYFPEHIQQELEQPNTLGVTISMEKEGRPVPAGYVALSVECMEGLQDAARLIDRFAGKGIAGGERVVTVKEIVVDEAHQGKGIGSGIMRVLTEYADQAGVWVLLQSQKSNRQANHLFSIFGFDSAALHRAEDGIFGHVYGLAPSHYNLSQEAPKIYAKGRFGDFSPAAMEQARNRVVVYEEALTWLRSPRRTSAA